MDELKVDVFDPASQQIEYKVGDKILTLRPMKWGAYRKMTKRLEDKNSDEATNVFDMLKILFPGPEHEFLTKEFFEDEMTLAMSAKIIQQSGDINGVSKAKAGV